MPQVLGEIEQLETTDHRATADHRRRTRTARERHRGERDIRGRYRQRVRHGDVGSQHLAVPQILDAHHVTRCDLIERIEKTRHRRFACAGPQTRAVDRDDHVTGFDAGAPLRDHRA